MVVGLEQGSDVPVLAVCVVCGWVCGVWVGGCVGGWV